MAVESSPLSALSSPSSFQTAPSSLTSRSDASESRPPPAYRKSRPLPRELRTHCQIYFEEQLFSNAINLLNSLLSAGQSCHHGTPQPSFVPPPVQLAFVANLMVHPSYTTKPDSPERRQIAGLAVSYLHNLLSIVGPIDGDLRRAFQFSASPGATRSRRRTPDSVNGNSPGLDGDLAEEPEVIRGRLGNEGSLWKRGQDFWAVVGWAFNCSLIHPNRWKWWRVWLDYMLRVLETDWDNRLALDEQAHDAADPGGEMKYTMIKDSMIMMYINQKHGRSSGLKWILKALFANGEKNSLSLFPEVYNKETQDAPRPQNKRKRGGLDLEENQFADYCNDDDDEDSIGEEDAFMSGSSAPPTPQKKGGAVTVSEGDDSTAMQDTIPFRLRIIRLLCGAALHQHEAFVNLEDLVDELSVQIKGSPLPIFTLYVTQRSSALDPLTLVFIIKDLLYLLLPASHFKPERVDAEADRLGYVTQEMLEKCYLPHAANTVAVEDNAKLSVLLEQLIVAMHKQGALSVTASLQEAAIKGVEARKKKARFKRVGKGQVDEADVFAKKRLEESGEKIVRLLDLIRAIEAKRVGTENSE